MEHKQAINNLVNQITNYIYEFEESKAYELLIDLVTRIQAFLDEYRNIVNDEKVYNAKKDRLMTSINNLVNFMEIRDNVLVSDIINYEILPEINN